MAAHPKGTSYGDAEASPSGRSTQRQGDKRSAPQGYLLRGTAADLIASNALLRARRKSPWGKAVRTKHVRMAQNITPGIQRGRQQGPRQSPTKWVWWGEEEQRND